MTPERFQAAKRIFLDACEQPRENREAYVIAACGDDVRLQRVVEGLLASDDAPMTLECGDMVRHHIEDVFADTAVGDQHVGTESLLGTLGEFRIIRKIGEGGMGSVYVAEQSSPRRTVALKTMRSDFAGREMLRRFQREIDLLGQLDHPGIARIFHAGTFNASGRKKPYFAMELIRGETLARSVIQRNLDRTARIRLLAEICDAVHFAHMRGVVHRDLKPGNIMVDENGRPVILDFGVARATGADLHATTLTVNAGQIIGTLAYMSPEQASSSSKDVDARSDIYSLGVILFELLTGRLPHDLEGKSIADAAVTIRDETPTRLSQFGRALRGDLDTIVGKAMQKDPSMRYASAADLSQDLQRFLMDQPIYARRPSAVYEIRKFAKRNRALVATVALAGVALIAVATFATFKAVAATEARTTAEQESERAKAATAFLSDLLASANPNESLGNEVTVRETLDKASEKLKGDAVAGHPDILAQLHTTIGSSYRALGLYNEANAHFEKALALIRDLCGHDDIRVAQSLDQLAYVHSLLNDYDTAEKEFREAKAIRMALGQGTQLLGDVWPHGLTSVLYFTGRFDEAEVEYRQAVAICREHGWDQRLAPALNGLGMSLEGKAQYDDAIKYLREAVNIYRRISGEMNSDVASTLNNLANCMEAAGRYQEARDSHLEALAIRQKIFEPDHPETASTLANLALVNLRIGEAAESEAMSRRALEIMKKRLPPAHHSSAAALNNLARAVQAQGRVDEALLIFNDAVTEAERCQPEGHLMILVLRANRASCRGAAGEAEAAESELKDCYDKLVSLLGPEHRRTLAVAEQIAELHKMMGPADELAGP